MAKEKILITGMNKNQCTIFTVSLPQEQNMLPTFQDDFDCIFVWGSGSLIKNKITSFEDMLYSAIFQILRFKMEAVGLLNFRRKLRQAE